MSYSKGAHDFYQLCAKKSLALTFDDVLLEPQYSEVESRKDVLLESNITPLRTIGIPLIASNMDTICESRMAIEMGRLGGLGVIHRYMPYEKQIAEIEKVCLEGLLASAAIGVKNGTLEHTKNLVAAGCSLIVIDIAHGYHKLVGDLLVELKALELISSFDNKPVEYIAGNVAIPQGVEYLVSKGADCIKVGVGPGSACSTRAVTGHGIPQLLAIASCSMEAARYKRTIIADGGLKTSGDIVKALAAGANTVMSGFLYAGTEETPGEYIGGQNYKEYRGMASSKAQKQFYGNDPEAPEGINTRVPYAGPVENIIKQLVAGIRSGLSYSGSFDLDELRDKASWIHVSSNSLRESRTIID